MDKRLNENMPIYMQIMNSITQGIISGELKSGERVASVRDLAEEFGVNPNTMQRALAELEREGLLSSTRTTGRFVTEDLKLIDKIRVEMAEAVTKEFVEKMTAMGFSREEIEDFFRKVAVERVG